jgi:hypothetical protein
MRSLLLVASFDLHPSNQYISVKVIPNRFRFAEMFIVRVCILLRVLSNHKIKPSFVLFDHITTCFGLYMWPSSGDFCDKILKIEVTTRYNGSVESNGI